MFERAVELLDEVLGCDGGTVVPASGSLPSPALSPAQLIDRITATEKLMNALQAEQARDLLAFAAARDAADRELGLTGSLQGRTASIEVGLALGVAPVTAACRIATAVSAVTHHAALVALLGTGRLSMGGLRVVLRATEVLESDQCRTVAAQLAEDATMDRLTPGMLERAATRRVLAVDPVAVASRAAAARRNRRVSVFHHPVEGIGVVWARLRAEEALAVHTSLDSRARCLRADGDERSITDLMCDLLVEDVTGRRIHPHDGSPQLPPAAMSPPPPGSPPDRDPDLWDLGCPDPYPDDWEPPAAPSAAPPPVSRRMPMKVEVQVVISAATLLGLDEQPALLRGYGAIPLNVVHDIVDSAASTTLRGLFCDPVDGRLLAMDSTARCFAGGLRQFGIYRDQRCRLSGGRIVDVDHIDEVHDGGPTSAGNGQGLAKNPHVIKDHPDIHVSVVTPQPVGDGLDKLRANAPTVAWTMPTGHTYPLPPPPTLGEGSRPTTIAASAPRDTQAADARLRDLRRRFEQPPTRTPKRRRPFVVRQEQRRYQRTQGRYDRQDTREDTALRRDADQTHRRHARQARDRRRQRRQRHPA